MTDQPATSVKYRMRLVALIAVVLVFPDSFAQGLYNTTGLYVDGASIYIDGTFTSEGAVENNGLVAVTGDWECIGSYQGKGTVEANGESSQHILHHRHEIHRFVANGEGAKEIVGTLTIAEQLSLQRGIIQVSPGDALVMKEKASVTGGSPESYVDGPLTVNGTGYKFFPVGKDNTYAPIEFIEVVGPPAQYSVEVIRDVPAVKVDGMAVQREYYWQREDLRGKFGGSAVAVSFPHLPFQRAEELVLVTGSDWAEPFQVITDLDRSKGSRLSSNRRILDRFILLGNQSVDWNEAGFYFSTALSPHAKEAVNRSVKIFGESLTSGQFRFQVFNRRGELIFESHSLDEMTTNGWDGRTMNGKQLMSGAYPYRLTSVDTFGRNVEKSGMITVVY